MRTSKIIFKQNFFTRQWRWKVVSSNNKIIGASSESYFNRKDCEDNSLLLGNTLVDLYMKKDI